MSDEQISTTGCENSTVREKDLREDFEKVNEQVQKTIREVQAEVPEFSDDNAETAFVVEPVYAYRVHASN